MVAICFPEDAFLLDDSNCYVMKELGRRITLREKRETNEKDKDKSTKKTKRADETINNEPEKETNSKWQSTHQELAEKRA